MAPANMLEMFERGVNMPLYASEKGFEKATTFFTSGRIDAGRGLRPTRIDHMILSDVLTTRLDTIRRYAGHEALHAVSMHAIQPNHIAPWEAFVARIEKELYGKRTEGAPVDKEWDHAAFASTTGFCAPDYSAIHFHDAFHAMYMAAYMALDHMSTRNVWRIWECLTQYTKEKGVLPGLPRMHEAMRAELNDDTYDPARSAVFSPIKTGMQSAVFPTKDFQARFFNFVVDKIQIPFIDAADRPVGNHIFRCTEMENRNVVLTPYDGDNQPIHDAGTVTIGSRNDVSFKTVEDGVRASGYYGQYLMGRTGDWMALGIPGLQKPVWLRRNR